MTCRGVDVNDSIQPITITLSSKVSRATLVMTTFGIWRQRNWDPGELHPSLSVRFTIAKEERFERKWVTGSNTRKTPACWHHLFCFSAQRWNHCLLDSWIPLPPPFCTLEIQDLFIPGKAGSCPIIFKHIFSGSLCYPENVP